MFVPYFLGIHSIFIDRLIGTDKCQLGFNIWSAIYKNAM